MILQNSMNPHKQCQGRVLEFIRIFLALRRSAATRFEEITGHLAEVARRAATRLSWPGRFPREDRS
jgi:hypothetical protein